MIETVVGTNVYDPPITAGSLVPNNVCFKVFKPATKSRVWITLAFSSYNNGKKHLDIFGVNLEGNPNKSKSLCSYISTSHLGNKRTRNENCSAKHHKIMLKPKKNGLGCIRNGPQ